MTAEFVDMDPGELGDPFRTIGEGWMLVTAGNIDSWNTMTASWGGMGVLWKRKVCFVFVRSSRHTFGFLENSEYFTLSFLPEEHRDILNYCGSHSGRDVDKARETGLRAIEGIHSTVLFEQASRVIFLRKIYFSDMGPEGFLDPSLNELYRTPSYHRMYVGEIVACRERRE